MKCIEDLEAQQAELADEHTKLMASFNNAKGKGKEPYRALVQEVRTRLRECSDELAKLRIIEKERESRVRIRDCTSRIAEAKTELEKAEEAYRKDPFDRNAAMHVSIYKREIKRLESELRVSG